MEAIGPNYKWLGFWTLDPIQNPDHLQPNLFWFIQIQIRSDSHIEIAKGRNNNLPVHTKKLNG